MPAGSASTPAFFALPADAFTTPRPKAPVLAPTLYRSRSSSSSFTLLDEKHAISSYDPPSPSPKARAPKKGLKALLRRKEPKAWVAPADARDTLNSLRIRHGQPLVTMSYF